MAKEKFFQEIFLFMCHFSKVRLRTSDVVIQGFHILISSGIREGCYSPIDKVPQVSEMINSVKAKSSKWINDNRYFRRRFEWQRIEEFQFTTCATILSGAPLPCFTFIGSAITYAPTGGNRCRLATFSNPGMFCSNKVTWVSKSTDLP